MTPTITRVDREAKQFIVERVFNAPQQLVFNAFTQAEHLVHWWGPRGWNLTHCEMDFREGGIWHYCMTGPNGEESWGKSVYNEIHAPEYYIYEDYFSDKDGNVSEGMPGMKIRNEFHAQADGSTKILSISAFDNVEDIDKLIGFGMVEGLTETWDRLEEYVTAK